MNGNPPLKLTPIYAVASRHGAQFVALGGWRLPERFGPISSEVAAARRGVALADCSANGKFTLDGLQATALLDGLRGLPDLPVNAATHTDFGYVGRLRHDRYFASTAPEAAAALYAAWTAAASASGNLITVTDVTDGRAELCLIGPSSAELLSRLCGLDLRESQFADLTLKQTSVAKTTQLVARHDLSGIPAYSLIGARSLGEYLWETLLTAGRDLGVAPIGQAALDSLGM